MGFFSDFTDDVLGIDPNAGGIYRIFDDVLGIDPNGGGIFSLLGAVGIESNAQDVYGYVDDLLGKGITSISRDYLGVPIEIDVELLASSKDPKVAINLDTGEFQIFEYDTPPVFDPSQYLASHGDLISAFGYDLEAATTHYQNYGIKEGRAIDLFNEAQYLASHGDLINAFGYDLKEATRHYIVYGVYEGRRTDLFDPVQYLENYDDLQAAFGNDLGLATKHYIEYGFSDGRVWTSLSDSEGQENDINQQKLIIDNVTFSSAGQNSWGTGDSIQTGFDWEPFSPIEWDYTDKLEFGFLEVGGGTSGDFHFRTGYEVDSGTIDSELPFEVVLKVPNQVAIDESITISTDYNLLGDAWFSTTTPYIKGYFDLGLEFYLGAYITIDYEIDDYTFDIADLLGTDIDYSIDFEFDTRDKSYCDNFSDFADFNINTPEIDVDGVIKNTKKLSGSAEDIFLSTQISLEDLLIDYSGTLGEVWKNDFEIDLGIADIGFEWNLLDLDLIGDISLKTSYDLTFESITGQLFLEGENTATSVTLEDGTVSNIFTLGEDIQIDNLTSIDIGDNNQLDYDLKLDLLNPELTTKVDLIFDLDLDIAALEGSAWYDAGWFGDGSTDFGPLYNDSFEVAQGSINIYENNFALGGFDSVFIEGFNLNWSEPAGSSDLNNLDFNLQLTQDAPVSGTELQGQTQNELFGYDTPPAPHGDLILDTGESQVVESSIIPISDACESQALTISSTAQANAVNEYLVGDWNGDGRDNIAVRRGNRILMDTNFDGLHNIEQSYGSGNSEDEYLVGDWNGDGRDNIAVRRGNRILMDTNFDGLHDIEQFYGNSGSDHEYLVGDWNGDGRDNIAIRQENLILMDTNFDGWHNIEQSYGSGNSEDEYLVGDWNGDGLDNIAVRRGNRILMDTNFDGWHNIEVFISS
ncbi:MAG: hypothetical protein AAF757_02855 [Cyanobacteria bacterium P01_D01_bin.116]